jgi:organic radical activating enzyme
MVAPTAPLRVLDLQFNVVEHCNLRCVECSHLSPWIAARSVSLQGFRRDVAALAAVLHAERFCFVGGEPLLHRDLVAFLEAVREARLADAIVVMTNGVLIDRMPDGFFRAIDRLELSRYPGTPTTDDKVRVARTRCARFGKQFRLFDRTEFRLMHLDRVNDDDSLVQQIYDSCQIAHLWNCHTIRDGMYYKCFRPAFTGPYLARKGVAAEDFPRVDGVAIHEPGLADRLRAYLADPTPLRSCRFCLGTVGKLVPHRQLSHDEVASTVAHTREPRLMVDTRLIRAIKRRRALAGIARARLPTWAYRMLRAAGSKIPARRERAEAEHHPR